MIVRVIFECLPSMLAYVPLSMTLEQWSVICNTPGVEAIEIIQVGS